MAKGFQVPRRKSQQHAASTPHKGNVGSQAGDCQMHNLLVRLTTMERNCYLPQTHTRTNRAGGCVKGISTSCQPLCWSELSMWYGVVSLATIKHLIIHKAFQGSHYDITLSKTQLTLRITFVKLNIFFPNIWKHFLKMASTMKQHQYNLQDNFSLSGITAHNNDSPATVLSSNCTKMVLVLTSGQQFSEILWKPVIVQESRFMIFWGCQKEPKKDKTKPKTDEDGHTLEPGHGKWRGTRTSWMRQTGRWEHD